MIVTLILDVKIRKKKYLNFKSKHFMNCIRNIFNVSMSLKKEQHTYLWSNEFISHVNRKSVTCLMMYVSISFE